MCHTSCFLPSAARPCGRSGGLAVAGVTHLPVDGFVAIVDERNIASCGVAERAGFTLDGPAEPWEHTESGPMLRYVFSPSRS
jgi:hypothetical protein